MWLCKPKEILITYCSRIKRKIFNQSCFQNVFLWLLEIINDSHEPKAAHFSKKTRKQNIWLPLKLLTKCMACLRICNYFLWIKNIQTLNPSQLSSKPDSAVSRCSMMRRFPVSLNGRCHTGGDSRNTWEVFRRNKVMLSDWCFLLFVHHMKRCVAVLLGHWNVLLMKM